MADARERPGGEGCDGGTPIAPENRRFSIGRSRQYARRNTGWQLSPGSVIGPARAGLPQAAALPRRCDSGRDSSPRIQSRPSAAQWACGPGFASLSTGKIAVCGRPGDDLAAGGSPGWRPSRPRGGLPLHLARPGPPFAPGLEPADLGVQLRLGARVGGLPLGGQWLCGCAQSGQLDSRVTHPLRAGGRPSPPADRRSDGSLRTGRCRIARPDRCLGRCIRAALDRPASAHLRRGGPGRP